MLGGGGIDRGRAGGVGSVDVTVTAVGARSLLSSAGFDGAGGTTESDPKIAGESLLGTTVFAGVGASGAGTLARVEAIGAGSAANSRGGSCGCAAGTAGDGEAGGGTLFFSAIAGAEATGVLGATCAAAGAGAGVTVAVLAVDGAMALATRWAAGVAGAVMSALLAGAGVGAGVAAVAAVAALAEVVAGACALGLDAIAGGALLVALAGRAATASGDNGGVDRAAAGGGTRTDGVFAGGGTETLFATRETAAVACGSSSSSSPASEGTFGAAGTAPSAGVFSASSPGRRTAGIAMLDARRVRAGGAAEMNTSMFAIARSGVQCCPSGESSSSGVILPSAIHARSSPLFGSAARVPFGRRTFHGR